ncbi:MAG: bifunctional UDP-N-acetylglucosamine diphosphorylase/glucosamine-1-phosphate N-acetyltransferase GlmU [Polyangiaceae bacterium]|nr:bifunctional UDP-N-acetylglucosamine diphosphorylase/glucosamine-1-phosphate N-acetyltransferase GlmU [Polyangiaceae bacterium]
MVDLSAVVLAAGEGKRMKSATSKVLHRACGRPLVYYPVRAAFDAGATRVVCVLSPRNRQAAERELEHAFGADRVSIAVQDPPLGTGHAAKIGLEQVQTSQVLLLCGDTPLLSAAHLADLFGRLDGAELVLTTTMLDDPTGYGRVLRGADGRVSAVREHKDLASDHERAVREINAGVYAAKTDFLRAALASLKNDNAQGEYYLTDVVEEAARVGAADAVLGPARDLLGVNDRAQLARAEALLFERIAERWARGGASVQCGAFIDETAVVEPDAVICAAAALRGRTVVRAGALVDTGAVITDSEIGPGARVLPYSVITDSQVAARAQIGPFAHLRPGSVIEDEAHVGNFVETKKTRLGRGAKANHLAYLGDGEVGERANIGAGTIFCNYDGFRKHQTVIGAGAFIGSDSQLVAPVNIGEGAYVATGTTVTRDVPADALAIGRTKQENKAGYASRLRARLSAPKKV